MRRKVYQTTMIDPPWPEKGGGGRGAQNHYPVLKIPEIVPVIKSAPNWSPARNAHLYFWVTTTYLPHGLAMLPELGFRYVNMVTWAKSRIGIGQYFRGKVEHMLFAVRGSGYAVRKPSRSIHNLIDGSTGNEHSRKPTAAYEKIEARSYGPYAELFARNYRPGWTSWGNELMEHDDALE